MPKFFKVFNLLLHFFLSLPPLFSSHFPHIHYSTSYAIIVLSITCLVFLSSLLLLCCHRQGKQRLTENPKGCFLGEVHEH